MLLRSRCHHILFVRAPLIRVNIAEQSVRMADNSARGIRSAADLKPQMIPRHAADLHSDKLSDADMLMELRTSRNRNSEDRNNSVAETGSVLFSHTIM